MSDAKVDWMVVKTLLTVIHDTVDLPNFKVLQAEATDALSAIQADVAAARKKFAEAAKEREDANAAAAKAAEAEKQAKVEAMVQPPQPEVAQATLFRKLPEDHHAS